MTTGRTGVLVLAGSRVALIERVRDGRQYWVIPGDRLESGETIEQAAKREGEEELGVAIRLGPLRVVLDHREADDSMQRQWYFEAYVDDEGIRMAGPETDYPTARGTYTAVWVELDQLEVDRVIPSAVGQLLVENKGVWTGSAVQIGES
jgi:ADP-ribose pyrophosphatase YjhB (NUDIX family)